MTGALDTGPGAARRCREATLDDVLAEPATRQLMRSDGVEEATLRALLAELGYRPLPRRS